MPIVKSKDAEIYYESHGEGPAVVFAHGRGGNATVWFQQTSATGSSSSTTAPSADRWAGALTSTSLNWLKT